MKAIFKTKDRLEAKRLAKADDMAACLWELVHNTWRQFKHTEFDYDKAWDAIRECLDEHNINVDDLTE